MKGPSDDANYDSAVQYGEHFGYHVLSHLSLLSCSSMFVVALNCQKVLTFSIHNVLMV